MNTGLFGGTFNPLHNGHIETIKYVADQFELKQVFFIPCSIPPHKDQKNLASAEYRFEMVKKSLKDIPNPYQFYASDIELNRTGPSYTIDTVREFKKNLSQKDSCFLILGSDAFFEIQTWKDFKEIFGEICVIIMLRNQEFEEEGLIEKVKSFLKKNISNDYRLDNANNIFVNTDKKNIFIANVPKINISSTMIRKNIKTGQSIKILTPHVVEKLIHEKGLYL